jgi:hypothetical protein
MVGPRFRCQEQCERAVRLREHFTSDRNSKRYTEIVSVLIAIRDDVHEESGRFDGCALQIASLRGFNNIVRR